LSGIAAVPYAIKVASSCLLPKGSAMTSGMPSQPIDILLFRRNRDQFPDKQLQPFWGKQVAWSADSIRGQAPTVKGTTGSFH
jgi:hypothetical protein